MIRGAVLLAALVSMVWSPAARTIVVAHDGRIEAFDAAGEKRLWSVDGVASPSAGVASRDGKTIAILDGFNDRVAVVSVADGAAVTHETPGTPVAAAFFGRDVWVVVRDRSRAVRITPDGQQTEVALALDPALIAVSHRFVYVYSRISGLLQEIDPQSMRVTRTAAAGTAGSGFEVELPKPGDRHGAIGFLSRPAYGKLVVIDLEPMDVRERNGGAPADPGAAPSVTVDDARFAWDAKSGRPVKVKG